MPSQRTLELLSNVTWSGARDLNPSLGEEGTGGGHEREVNNGMDRVAKSLTEAHWWRNEVGQTGRSVELRAHTFLDFPGADESDKEVVGEASVEHLRDEEEVGGQSGLQPTNIVSVVFTSVG